MEIPLQTKLLILMLLDQVLIIRKMIKVNGQLVIKEQVISLSLFKIQMVLEQKFLNEQAKVNVPITNSPYALAASNFANNKSTDSKQAYIDKYQKSPELAKTKSCKTV